MANEFTAKPERAEPPSEDQEVAILKPARPLTTGGREKKFSPVKSEAVFPAAIGLRVRDQDTTLIESDADAVQRHLRQIEGAFNEQNRCGLITAELCAAAEAALSKEQLAELKKKVPFGAANFSKYVKVAKHKLLRDCAARGVLPPCFSTRYELTFLGDSQIDDFVAAGKIHAGMTRDDAKALREARVPRATLPIEALRAQDTTSEGLAVSSAVIDYAGAEKSEADTNALAQPPSAAEALSVDAPPDADDRMVAKQKPVRFAEIMVPADYTSEQRANLEIELEKVCNDRGAEYVRLLTKQERFEITYYATMSAFFKRCNNILLKLVRQRIRELRKQYKAQKREWKFAPEDIEIPPDATLEHVMMVLADLGIDDEFDDMRVEAERLAKPPDIEIPEGCLDGLNDIPTTPVLVKPSYDDWK